MPKTDFLFYKLGGELPEFVVPKPNNDYYSGAFVPSLALDAMAVRGVYMALSGRLSTDISVVNIPGETLGHNYFFNAAIEKHEPHFQHKSHVKARADLPADMLHDEEKVQEEVHKLVGRLYEDLRNPAPLLNTGTLEDKDVDKDTKGKLLDRLTPIRSDVEMFPYIENWDTGEPKNPSLGFAEYLPLRVYRWMEGKRPTFNTRPFTLLVARTVEIELINPKPENS